MIFSRQFKALARIALVFAGAWAIIGGIIALFTGSSDLDGGRLGWVLTYMFMYAAVGAIAGLVTALLVARAETGGQVAHLVTRRFVIWGVLGGLAPVALFGLLGAVFGAPTEALIALAALAVVNAGLGGAVAASSAAVAKRGAIAPPPSPPRFPAT